VRNQHPKFTRGGVVLDPAQQFGNNIVLRLVGDDRAAGLTKT